jgi:hypothetical protein
MIIKGLAGEHLPLYGDGKNVRDWLYVEDHAKALSLILEHMWWKRSATFLTDSLLALRACDAILSPLSRIDPDMTGGTQSMPQN